MYRVMSRVLWPALVTLIAAEVIWTSLWVGATVWFFSTCDAPSGGCEATPAAAFIGVWIAPQLLAVPTLVALVAMLVRRRLSRARSN